MYKMPYVRKTNKRKPAYKKRNYGRSNASSKKMYNIAKKVSLSQQETKHHVVNYGTHSQYHNVTHRLVDNILAVQQGTNDGNNQSRIGDKIFVRGVKMYMHFEGIYDRPDITWRIVVLKAPDASLGSGMPLKGITGNALMDPINTETATVVKSFYIKPKYQDYSYDPTVHQIRPMSVFRKLWIPVNKQYTFNGDNSPHGKWYDYAVYCVAFSQGAIITDHIGSLEFSSEMFFKDA